MTEGMALATLPPSGRTTLLDEGLALVVPGQQLDSVSIAEPDSTGGFATRTIIGSHYPSGGPSIHFWRESGEVGKNVRVVLVQQRGDVVVLDSPNERDLTLSPSAPMFGVVRGTGEMNREFSDSLHELWSHYVPSAAPIAGIDMPMVLDVPTALQQARSQAGLPVQDLAAMFGFSRRQFYNLVEGKQNTDEERAPRIARVTDAVERVSDWVGGSSRKARSLLLARLEGDSVYDAAAVDDADRLDRALERAHAAFARIDALPPRLAPSNRATSSDAAAVRNFLRATRDDSGAANDR